MKKYFIPQVLLCIAVILLAISSLIRGFAINEMDKRIEKLEQKIIIESGEIIDVD